MKEKYVDYYKHHDLYGNKEWFDEKEWVSLFQKFDANFWSILKTLDKNTPILEIGCGQGYFAHYLKKLWFQNYTGFDFDEKVVVKNNQQIEWYKFYSTDVQQYLDENTNNIGMIFMSHVFEHLTKKDAMTLSEKIYTWLKPNGYWLNIMPNAGSLLWATYLRYTDVTHEILYNSNSFSQLLMASGFQKESIQHKNKTTSNLVLNWGRKIIISFLRILIKILWYPADTIYTSEIVTIIKK